MEALAHELGPCGLPLGHVNLLGAPVPDLISVPDFAETLAAHVARGIDAQLETGAALTARSPTYDKFKYFEQLDGSGNGPPLAGDPAVLDALLEHAERSFELHRASFEGEVLNIHAAGGPALECRTIKAAKAPPLWNHEGGGYRASPIAEIERVFNKFKALRVCTMTEYRKAQEMYGRGNVFMKHLVIVSKAKELAKGGFDRFKTRITYADLKSKPGPAPTTYAPSISAEGVRTTLNVGVRLGAIREVKDVGGAYLFGTPPHPSEPGGRALFARMPGGLAELLGVLELDENGELYIIAVDGNVPGRREAGRTWSRCYADFMEEQGFTASTTERRLYYKFRGSEFIICAVYVDGNLFMHSEGAMWDEFEAAWCERFDEHGDPTAMNDEFCGLYIEDLPGGWVALSAPKVLHHLKDELAKHPVPARLKFNTPVGSNGLKEMAEPVSDTNPLLDAAQTEAARALIGTAGWLCNAVRLDGLLGYVNVSQYVGHKLTATTSSPHRR